jgi:predicted ArsR family transcriptional regulator
MSIVQNNGSNKITTQDLAMRLDTTVRNANRIMQNLCKGNIAKPVYTQSSHSRGRPVQVYALDFENTAG